MNIENRKPPLKEFLVSLTVVVAVAHILSIKYLNYPFLYCWLGGIVTELWDVIAAAALMLLFIYAVFCVFTLKWTRIVIVALIYLLLQGTSQFADTLFRMGGVCIG